MFAAVKFTVEGGIRVSVFSCDSPKWKEHREHPNFQRAPDLCNERYVVRRDSGACDVGGQSCPDCFDVCIAVSDTGKSAEPASPLLTRGAVQVQASRSTSKPTCLSRFGNHRRHRVALVALVWD